jgi:hypothetical protein
MHPWVWEALLFIVVVSVSFMYLVAPVFVAYLLFPGFKSLGEKPTDFAYSVGGLIGALCNAAAFVRCIVLRP